MKIDKMKLDLAMANKAYSAKELSQKCGVSQVTIVRITKGVQDARPGTVGKIAKALDVPVIDIIENTAATDDKGKQRISGAKRNRLNNRRQCCNIRRKIKIRMKF